MARYGYSSLSSYVWLQQRYVGSSPLWRSHGQGGSYKDSIIIDEVHVEESDHLNGIAQSNNNLINESQLINIVNKSNDKVDLR